MEVNLVQLASDAFETIYANAAEDGLGAFAMFWHNSAAEVRYLSLDEFETQKTAFEEIGVVQEGSIVKKLNDGFVEYILFNRHSAQPHHLALALTATVIKRELLYVVCYPVDSISQEVKSELEAKFQEQENRLSEDQAEVSDMLENVGVVLFTD